MASKNCVPNETFTNLHYDQIKELIVKNKLFSELSKLKYDDEDSIQSGKAYIIASQKLKNILHQREEGASVIFLTKFERERMNYTCTFIKVLMDFKFNYKEFYEDLCNQLHFPLEFIFRLHLLGIMSLETYLLEIKNQPEILSNFHKAMVLLLSMELPEDNFKHCMVSGIGAYIAITIFISDSEDEDLEIKKVSQLILDSTLKRLLCFEAVESEEKCIPSLIVLCSNANICDSISKKFCIYALKFSMTYNANIHMTQAISEQHNWTYKKYETSLSYLIQKIFVILDVKDVFSIFEESLCSKEVNWKSFLLVLSLYLSSSQNVSSQVLIWIDTYLKLAFETLDKSLLLQVFLIVRHTTLSEHCDSSSGYVNWFQKYFGETTSSLVNDMQTFEFFLTFLTDIVPFEPEQYLKIHIDRPIHIVDQGRAAYMDYVALVKTRLSELKPQSSPETVLKKMLVYFETSGKIPSAVLEKSMLQKYEYLNSFLPCLLAPRVLPPVPDVQMKFIEALKQIDKIPKDMYNRYEAKCKVQKLIDVEPLDIEISEIDSQLADLTMPFTLQIQECRNDTNLLKNFLGRFRQNLLTILKQINRSDIVNPVIMSDYSVDNYVKEAINDIVNCYCSFQTETSQLIPQISLLWDLANDLKDFRNLHDVLYIVIWEKLISSQSEKETVLLGLSSLLFKITFLHNDYPSVKDKDDNAILLYNFIFKNLPFTTSDEINFFCRFSHSYLKLAIVHIPQTLPTLTSLPPLISVCHLKKFQYAAVRSIPQLRLMTENLNISNDPLVDVYKMCKSKLFCHLFTLTKLTFEEWLNYESKIIPEKDNLCNERFIFAHWCIQHLCLIESNSPNLKLQLCCSVIMKVLLQKYDQCASFKEILEILKNLVNMLSNDKSDIESRVPWLYEAFYSVAAKYKNSNFYDFRIHVLLKRFTRLICELPPFILFKESVSQTILNVTELKILINDWFKLYNGREFCLSSDLTCHILKGLLQDMNNSGDFEENNKRIKAFLLDSPFFVISIIEHWPTVKSKIRYLSSKQLNYLHLLLQEINQCIKWTNNKVLEKVATFTPKELPDWLWGYIIFNKQNKSLTYFPYSTFKDGDPEVLGFTIQFYLAFISSIEIQDIHPHVKETMKWLMELEQDKFIDPLYYNTSSVKAMLSTSVWYHFPANCLWVLLHMNNESEIQNLNQQTLIRWIILILNNLSECNRQYSNKSFVNQYYLCASDDKVLKKPYGILNLHFIQDVTEKVKNIICSISLECIQLIPDDVVESCDEYLKCFLSLKTNASKSDMMF